MVRQSYKSGKCDICGMNNVKIIDNLCKGCGKLVEYDIDTLQNAVLYLKGRND